MTRLDSIANGVVNGFSGDGLTVVDGAKSSNEADQAAGDNGGKGHISDGLVNAVVVIHGLLPAAASTVSDRDACMAANLCESWLLRGLPTPGDFGLHLLTFLLHKALSPKGQV
jgi:hypothetical protein